MVLKSIHHHKTSYRFHFPMIAIKKSEIYQAGDIDPTALEMFHRAETGH
jgi:hypothetical protein